MLRRVAWLHRFSIIRSIDITRDYYQVYGKSFNELNIVMASVKNFFENFE